jgi:hypothetical protein
MRLALVALLLAGCGSVILDPPVDVDAGGTSEVGSAARADAGVELASETPRTDGGALDVPPAAPLTLPACAAALPSSSCSSCPRGPTGEDLTSQCRAVVACVASDPHYSPLVQTCAMQVGPGAQSCVAALLAGCGT